MAIAIYIVTMGILIATGRHFYPGGERIVTLTIDIFLLLYGTMWILTIIEVVINTISGMKRHIELMQRRIRVFHSVAFIRFVVGTIIAFQISITAYSNFKQNIWTYVDKTYDAALNRVDSSIYIGNTSLSELRNNRHLKPFAPFLDRLYYFYFANKILILAVFLFILGHRSNHLHSFLLGQNLLWGLGVFLFLIYPALGPCYYHPEVYYKSGNPMLIAFTIQNALLKQHKVLFSFPESFMPVPFFGISAMPSFHVAASFYYFITSFWIKKWWIRLYCGLFFAGIFLGSLYTGWHYLLDGIAGMIWAVCVYLLVLSFQHAYK